VLEIGFTLPLFAEHICRPLLAWFVLEKRVAMWCLQWSGLLQNFFKQINLTVFYPYSTTDTFCSQQEDMLTVRREVLYRVGFPSEAWPWIAICGGSLSSNASHKQNMWCWAIPICVFYKDILVSAASSVYSLARSQSQGAV